MTEPHPPDRDPSATRAPRIASSALIEEDVSIGSGCAIWDLSQIRVGASLGTGCTIGRNVFIDHHVSIGDACKVQNNALIYHPCRLGRGVFVGPGAVLTNDPHPRAILSSGQPVLSSDWLPRETVIEEGAAIGANVTVVAGVTIGRWSMIGAGAVVAKNVAPFTLVTGVPAKAQGWIGKSGHRLIPRADSSSWEDPTTGELFVERDGILSEA